MRILLIAPLVERGNKYLFPLGLAYLSSSLKQAGFDVHCHNQAFDDDPDSALRMLLEHVNPDVVGVGGLTPSFSPIRAVVETVRQQCPSAFTVLGGGVLSSAPDTVFRAIAAHVGVIGEGEATAVELMAALRDGGDFKAVPGLVIRSGEGDLVTTPPRELITDIDTIPLPDYAGFGLERCLKHVEGTIDIIASRGCPFMCTFCYSALGRRRHRLRSLDNLFAEIDLLATQFPVERFGIMDELFSANPERIRLFCDRMKGYGLPWYTQVRVDSVDRDTLRYMSQANCKTVFYGFESMSLPVLKSMNKKIRPETVESAARLSYDVNMGIFANFIFGDPAETLETATETLRWWFANRRYHVNMGFITCWPGTKIYTDAVARGVIADPLRFIEEGCPQVNITAMPDALFSQLNALVVTTHSAMLWPAKLLHAEEGSQGWDVSCICPHCQARAEYAGVTERAIPSNRNSVRVGCPHCARDMDLPLAIPARSMPQGARRAYEAAHSNLAAGDENAAVASLRGLVGEFGTCVEAWQTLGLVRFKRGEWAHALFALGQVLSLTPYRFRLFEAYASLLERAGWEEFALHYYGQSLILQHVLLPGMAGFDEMEETLLSMLQSDAPSTAIQITLEQAMLQAGLRYEPEPATV